MCVVCGVWCVVCGVWRVVWCGVMWCGVVPRGGVGSGFGGVGYLAWCDVVWRGVAWRGVAWCGVMCCCVVCCAVLCCAVLYAVRCAVFGVWCVVWCGVRCGVRCAVEWFRRGILPCWRGLPQQNYKHSHAACPKCAFGLGSGAISRGLALKSVAGIGLSNYVAFRPITTAPRSKSYKGRNPKP